MSSDKAIREKIAQAVGNDPQTGQPIDPDQISAKTPQEWPAQFSFRPVYLVADRAAPLDDPANEHKSVPMFRLQGQDEPNTYVVWARGDDLVLLTPEQAGQIAEKEARRGVVDPIVKDINPITGEQAPGYKNQKWGWFDGDRLVGVDTDKTDSGIDEKVTDRITGETITNPLAQGLRHKQVYENAVFDPRVEKLYEQVALYMSASRGVPDETAIPVSYEAVKGNILSDEEFGRIMGAEPEIKLNGQEKPQQAEQEQQNPAVQNNAMEGAREG